MVHVSAMPPAETQQQARIYSTDQHHTQTKQPKPPYATALATSLLGTS